jgi:hypothetical protein
MNEPLYTRYFDKSLSADDCRKLKDLLRADPDARREFARFTLEQGLFIQTSGRLAQEREVASGRLPDRPALGLWKRVIVPLAAAASILAAVGVWWWSGGRSSVAGGQVIARVDESVQCSVFGVQGRTRELAPGAEIRAGDRIETGDKGRVKLAWVGRETTAELSEHSSLCILHASLSRLSMGRMTATVAKQAARAPFVVETPQARATVVGTRFSVLVSDAMGTNASPQSAIRNPHSAFAFTRLDVSEGRVGFARLSDGMAVDVSACQFAIAGKDYALRPYRDGTEYVDGPILFQDNFERPVERALENWNFVLWATNSATGEVTTRTPTAEMLVRCLDIGTEVVGGTTSQTVRLDFDALRGKFPDTASVFVHMNLALWELAEQGPVSVEYDLWLAPDSAVSLLMGREYEGGQRTAPTLNPRTDDATRLGEQGSRSRRIEIYPRTGSAGRRAFEFRHFIDGTMVQQQTREFQEFQIGCGLSQGKAKLDNVVVRRMVPAQDKDR